MAEEVREAPIAILDDALEDLWSWSTRPRRLQMPCPSTGWW